eukprot:TRINITY_DN11203_c0_g3_i2.p1 TRINITY_DN11203_c0_g3~~TRINITY_DN11203_c0_g3_i2.p1  ORF type:complete len:305 (+),score=35.97 TRINITY_DN11203_c0_g3_i2:65-979(+)
MGSKNSKSNGAKPSFKTGAGGSIQAVTAPVIIPKTSVLVDDVSYDLWKASSGGGANGWGRGMGERYEDGTWEVVHPAVEVRGRSARLGEQGVADTYGAYGMMWSSAIRPGTAFGIRLTASGLKSLVEGYYEVGLVRSQRFDPLLRPHPNSWIPQYLCSANGKVSIAGQVKQFPKWDTTTVEIGFVVRTGAYPGRVSFSTYINNEAVVDSMDMKLPEDDSLHLFTFINYVGDTVEWLPNWRPPVPRDPHEAAQPPGKGKKGGGKGSGKKGGYGGKKGSKGGMYPKAGTPGSPRSQEPGSPRGYYG